MIKIICFLGLVKFRSVNNFIRFKPINFSLRIKYHQLMEHNLMELSDPDLLNNPLIS